MTITVTEPLLSAHAYASRIYHMMGEPTPPISEYEVAEFLGLEIKPVTQSDIEEFLTFHSSDDDFKYIFGSICSWLHVSQSGRSTIFVNDALPVNRRRFSILHECGHHIIPWHQHLNYICSVVGLSNSAINQYEKEANACAAELLMPRKHFKRDLKTLSNGIPSIHHMSEKYEASREAVAIRYTRLHADPVAMAIVEGTGEYLDSKKYRTGGVMTLGEIMKMMWDADEEDYVKQSQFRFPIRIKYFIPSPKFPLFVKPGQILSDRTIIFHSWMERRALGGRFRASEIWPDSKLILKVETMPFSIRIDSDILVLLDATKQVRLVTEKKAKNKHRNLCLVPGTD